MITATRPPEGSKKTPAQREDEAMLLESEFTDILRTEIGMHEAFAMIHAQAIVRGLRRLHGSQRIYIPGVSKAERDEAIRKEFNGQNTADMMKKYHLSRTRLYEIVGAR